MLGHPKFSVTHQELLAEPVVVHDDGQAVAFVDRTVFEQWYERYVDDVFGYVARRLGAQIAEDLTSETFVQAWRHRERFEASRGVPRAWLFGIATNLMRDHRRAEQRQLAAFARTGVDIPDGDGDPARGVGRIDVELAWPQVAAALSGLGHDERDVVWLHAVGELTYVEIAQALDIPVGTVRSRISRARARLARVLARHAPTPGSI